MGIAPHIARLRAFVGHEQLLLPCATVLPLDERGRVLLAWAAGHTDGWGTVGGAVDPGESPAQAAIREAREEIGVEIRLTRLVDVLGGADYEVTYPNGDRAAYVTAVYEAGIVDGVPAPADGELSDVGWFTREELPTIPLSRFTRALLTATGYLPGPGGAVSR
jgi:8-oxo-dGTP pyrophosphatase MutT (NUDIX family)